MRATLRIRPATSWNGEGIYLCGGEEYETPFLMMLPKPLGYNRLTDDQQSRVVRAILHQLDGVELDIPGELADYTGARKPDYIRIAEGGSDGTVRVRGSSSLPPADQIPRNEHGEVIVPPRLKVEDPEYKKRRRALRSLRNKEREAKEASRR